MIYYAQMLKRAKPHSTPPKDYDQIFRDFFQRYVHDMYRIVLAAASYDEALAQRLLHTIFMHVHKYLHTLVEQGSSIRLYVLAHTAHELAELSARIPSPHAAIPKKIKAQLTPIELKLWQVVHALPRPEWLLYELWYGEKLDNPELAVVLQQSQADIQALQTSASQYLRRAVPHFEEYLPTLFDKRNQLIRLSAVQQAHLLRQILKKRKRSPTFIEYSWWRRIVQPIPLAVSAGIVVLLGLGGVTAYYYPTFWQARVAPLTQFSSAYWDSIEPLYVSDTRPRPVDPDATLPLVFEDKLSLTKITEPLFGTQYVAERTPPTDDAALTPTITMALPEQEYIPVTSVYAYAVPQALDEDQLQYAALRHFASLPLNQFEYVNGTYYMGDDTEMYQPLFIAFNANGSIDFQMRQLAICELPNLTDHATTREAETAGFDFLTAHNFVEVMQTDLAIQLVSAADRTVPKDAFCNDGDEAAVQDRELVYFAPHTVLRYADGVADVLPMRFPGMALQLHGEHMTNARLDKLFLLHQSVVRTHAVDIKSLEHAIAAVRKFSYPAAADRATEQQHQQVFMQWNHEYGDDRLTEITMQAVRLEYVFDELHYVIEPYYVFTGQGKDRAGRTVTIRLYVVAAKEDRDLRSPYRQ